MHRTLVLLCAVATVTATVATTSALAQQARPAPKAISYPSVAAALADLQARDGKDTVLVQSDGWTIVNEPAAAAQWHFAPTSHAAHPAVLRRVVKRAAGRKPTVETSSLCEAGAEACAKLLADFAAMNERISQAAGARAGPAGAPAPR